MSVDDERKLTPANERPWYWLATLYGEQPEGANLWDFDKKLAEKNRVAWNRWIARAMGEEQRKKLIAAGVDLSELTPFSEEEEGEFLKQFAKRAANERAQPPGPLALIYFRNLRFERAVIFSGFVFPSNVEFSESAFSRHAEFAAAVFSGWASFSKTAFSRSAFFPLATFSDKAFFEKAAFSETVFFTKATFSDEAEFHKTAFCGKASFEEAKFSGHANFIEATFSRGAELCKAVFSCKADFEEAKFSGATSFNETRFSKDVNFQRAEFKSLANFANARFGTHAPDFRNAKLSEAMEWHGVIWSPTPRDQGDAQQQVYAYERLKAEMERLKKHEDEQLFFAQELRARRALLWFKLLAPVKSSPAFLLRRRSGTHQLRWRVKIAIALYFFRLRLLADLCARPKLAFDWLLNYAYDLSSGYGQSITRPIIWLLVLVVAGTIAFVTTPSLGDGPMHPFCAASFSVSNIFSFLPFKPGGDVTKNLSIFAKIVGDVQFVLGVVLLFLLGLGVRNRFRMK